MLALDEAGGCVRCAHSGNEPLGLFCAFRRYFQSIQADKFGCELKSFKPPSRFSSSFPLALFLSIYMPKAVRD